MDTKAGEGSSSRRKTRSSRNQARKVSLSSNSSISVNITKKNPCDYCNEHFGTFPKYVQHLKLVHKQPMKCKPCDKIFVNVRVFAHHMKNHRKEKSLLCDKCDFITHSKTSFDNHKLTRHKIGTYPFKCSICDKGFLSTYYLSQHMNRHTGSTPYQCDKCGASYHSPKPLKLHFIKAHPEASKPIFRCTFCSTFFQSKKNLDIHKNNKHAAGKNICEYCGKEFSFKDSLIRHKRIHTGEKPKECPVCKKRFICASYLQCHLRVHTGERPYKCQLCYKAFTQRSSLVTHQKCHSKLGQTESTVDLDKIFT